MGPDGQLRLQPQPRPTQHLHGRRYGPAGLRLPLWNVRKTLSAILVSLSHRIDDALLSLTPRLLRLHLSLNRGDR